MKLNKNKIIILLLLLVACWQFIINKKDPQQEIAKKMIESEKHSYTGYRIFSQYKEVITKKNEIRSYYSSSDLQKMIYKAKPYSVINLDKDVYLKFAIFIDKPLTIKGVNSNVKILSKDVASMFMTNVNDIAFDNLNFYLIDTLFFLQSDSNDNLEPLRTNLSITNSTLTLEGKSNNLVRMNNLKYDNVVVKNKTLEKNSDCSLLEYFGDTVLINNSIFLDFNNTCNGSLRFKKIKKGLFSNSVFIGFPFGLNGVVSFDKSDNINFDNNVFLDLNREFRENSVSENINNLQEVDDEDTDIIIGSIGLSLYESNATFLTKNVMVTDNPFYSDKPIKNSLLATTIVNDQLLNNITKNNYNIKCKTWEEVLRQVSQANVLNSFCIK